MMKLLFLSTLVVATVTALPSPDQYPDGVVPETGLVDTNAFDPAQEAQSAITVMLQEGKDEGACAALAASTVKEVEDAVNAQQEILNALDTGSDCHKEGQAGVDLAQQAVDSATSKLSDAEKAFSDAESAPVSVPAKPFTSLKEGDCAFFFGDSAYTSAKVTFENAKSELETARGAKKAADDALAKAKEEAAKAVEECQCDVRAAYNKAWEAANANNDENEKAFTKGKHMSCVLEGTTPADCNVGEIPKVKPIELADGVPAEPCPKYKHISYIGCFGDNGDRDLKHGPKNYGFSPRTCHDACGGYKYFALQNGGWCNCDNSYSDGWSGSGGRGSYNALANSECDKDGVHPGRGMGGGWANAIYEMKDSHHSTSAINFVNDMQAWTQSGCHLSDDQAQCKQGSYQSRTKLPYSAPITVSVEMKQIEGGDECGVFQVFGRVNERHGGYNAGMGWWVHYLGYGFNTADGHGAWQGKDGSTKNWRQITISVHTNGVATYWVDGQKWATKQGSTTSGHLSIGMNCRTYDYRHMHTSRNNW